MAVQWYFFLRLLAWSVTFVFFLRRPFSVSAAFFSFFLFPHFDTFLRPLSPSFFAVTMTYRAWAIFRTVRVLIFGKQSYLVQKYSLINYLTQILALSTILSLAWTIIYTVLLLREWKEYNLSERKALIMFFATPVTL